MNYKEFETKVLKRCFKGPSKIRNSWGVYDAYKHIRKNHWYDIGKPVKESDFYHIIREVNKILAENLALGESVIFPYRMGKLELRKFERGASIVNGKLKITYPIDWPSTLRLWFEDEEEKKKKTLIRFNSKYTYHVRYDKYHTNYENCSYYEFAINRNIKNALKSNIQKSKVDTLW